MKARGSASRFDDRLQMKIDQLRRAAPGEVDKVRPAALHHLRRCRPLAPAYSALSIASPTPTSSCLLSAILADPAIAEAYREAPAAKQLHHAWLGGLLEHVVSLLTLADRVAPHYPLLDRDLLLTGVLLHDIGKIRELSWEIGFEYTVEGVLLGHIQIGAALAERAMDSLPNFPPKLKTLVLHMILSHHGKLEFGSPKLPMIPEALVLNFLDDLDAKMQAVQGEFDKSIREGKGPGELTGKVWALDNRQLIDARRWLAED